MGESKLAENSQKTAKRRGPGRRFQPGESGNPGGRPRKTPEQGEIEELARCYSVEAMNRLRQIALHGRDNDAVRACEAILDRAWGRTSQHIPQSAENRPSIKLELILSKPGEDDEQTRSLADESAEKESSAQRCGAVPWPQQRRKGSC